MTHEPVQTYLFAEPEPVLIKRAVDPSGAVRTEEDIRETLFAESKTRCSVRIELAQETSGLWMFGISVRTPTSGYSYCAGAKWGEFASSRDDAVFFAKKDITERMTQWNYQPYASAVSKLLLTIQ